jgi:leucyl-tRNA synthetase
LINFREPVKKLLYNGYINAPDGKKMSKSKGNVVDPLEIIDAGYGADTLRTYELFIGPYDMDAAWDPRAIGGVYRFLTRIWNLVQEFIENGNAIASEAKQSGGDCHSELVSESQILNQVQDDNNKTIDCHDDKSPRNDNTNLLRIINKTIKKVTEDLGRSSFNTAVASMMECANELYKIKDNSGISTQWKNALGDLMKLLAPFAPHLAAELFEQLGFSETIEESGWPTWDEKYLKSDTVTIAVQVNGKLRGKITVAIDTTEEEIKKTALEHENVARFVDEKTLKKIIYVPNKIVNIVV